MYNMYEYKAKIVDIINAINYKVDVDLGFDQKLLIDVELMGISPWPKGLESSQYNDVIVDKIKKIVAEQPYIRLKSHGMSRSKLEYDAPLIRCIGEIVVTVWQTGEGNININKFINNEITKLISSSDNI
jgi:hypothetical protein